MTPQPPLALAFSLVAIVALGACATPLPPGAAPVTIAGKPFHLEIASDPAARDLGLGGRTHIDPRGGMIFVFPEPQWQEFVMRDCPVPIDLLFLDADARILALYAMRPEPPRTPDERADSPAGDFAYTARLQSYPSHVPCQLVIELRGGTIHALGLHQGDHLVLDTNALLALAK